MVNKFIEVKKNEFVNIDLVTRFNILEGKLPNGDYTYTITFYFVNKITDYYYNANEFDLAQRVIKKLKGEV